MSKPRVLVIDDEPVIREFVTSSLTQQGYSVLATGSVEEALRLARRGELKLALLELCLSGCDAQAVGRMLLRAQPGLTCGYLTWADWVTAEPLLRKPFSHRELASFVGGLLASGAGANPFALCPAGGT
jgi:two-component system, cell cycle sensor histidine kinase and response regulator CckA